MLFVSNEQNKRLISYKMKNNKLINIYKYIYCDELIETKEKLTNKYIFDILKNLKTNYRLKFDSFLNYELKINDFNDLIICGKGKNFNINHINIVVSSEEIKKTKWDSQNGNLIIPLWQKGLLETYSEKKTDIKKINIEKRNKLLKLKFLENFSKNNFEQLVTSIEICAKEEGLEKEFILLKNDAINLYKENEAVVLEKYSLPYINYFNIYANYLNNNENLILINKNNLDKNFIKNWAFFESFFSNYIEGTKFIPDEAVNIIFNNKLNNKRLKDNYDLIQNYLLIIENINNPIDFKNYEDFKKTLFQWHKFLFEKRKEDILVGKFKEKNNMAGSTYFLDKDLVDKTLEKTFDIYQKIKNPLNRALFLKTTFVKIHPFEDGNGRLSRLLLNNELSLYNYQRIIIPTILREDYILNIKEFCNNNYNNFSISSFINKSYKAIEEINFNQKFNYVMQELENKNAFSEDLEEKWKFNKFEKINKKSKY